MISGYRSNQEMIDLWEGGRQEQVREERYGDGRTLEELPAKRPRLDEASLENTPFVTKIYNILPEGVLQMVFAFITKEVTYKVMIQHRSFSRFLAKIKEYANLRSTDEAIDYYWWCNVAAIRSSLPLKQRAVCWAASGSIFEAPNHRKIKVGMTTLRCVSKRFLIHRKWLSPHANRSHFGEPAGRIMFNADSREPGFKARWNWPRIPGPGIETFRSIGLLASEQVDTSLAMYDTDTDLGNLVPLSTLLTLRALHVSPRSLDLTPISYLVNLRELVLGHKPVSDISFLKPLVNLTLLKLGISVGVDLSPISSSPKLKALVVCLWSGISKKRSRIAYISLTAEQIVIFNDAMKLIPKHAAVKSYYAVTPLFQDIEYRRFRNTADTDDLWGAREADYGYSLVSLGDMEF